MLFAIPVQLKAPFSALKQTSSYKWVTFEGVLAILKNNVTDLKSFN